MRTRLLLLLSLAPSVLCNMDTHSYTSGDDVPVWANKIGPFDNPHETYQYYTLPFCRPESEEVHHPEGLGEVLEGNRLLRSLIRVSFLESVENARYCEIAMDARSAVVFSEAVRQNYWYQMIVDDLPMWAMLGARFQAEDAGPNAEPVPYMYTHRTFDFAVNGNRFIEANLTSANPEPILPGQNLVLTYSVHWHATDHEFAYRYTRYLDFNFFEHQVHWFSIVNSFMMVMFLVGLVAMILMRTLRNDFAKYALSDDLAEMDADMTDDSGWKQVSADVFRAPAHLELFSACVGSGAQLALLILVVILFAAGSTWEIGRAKIFTAAILWYALTSFAAGYFGGAHYSRCGGKKWIRTMLMTATMVPGNVFGTVVFLNAVASSYGSLAAIPFGTIVSVILIWAFLSFPLTLFGTIVGRNWSGTPSAPIRVNVIPRFIPEKPWFLHPVAVCLLGGALPFGAIFVELFFVFNSLFLYRFYYLYGFMLLVFVILLLVTVCVTIVSTYFLLNAEEHRWQWFAFLSSASTAFYVYIYSVYFFLAKTQMAGFLQTSYYFGTVGVLVQVVALLCGSVGYFGASTFVHAIYRNIKND